jgi:hypothetical protein
MAKKLTRHWRGYLHFITFSCYRRLPLLRSVRARNVFVSIRDDVRDGYGSPWWALWSCPSTSIFWRATSVARTRLLIREPADGTFQRLAGLEAVAHEDVYANLKVILRFLEIGSPRKNLDFRWLAAQVERWPRGWKLRQGAALRWAVR